MEYRGDTLDDMYWHIYNDIVARGEVRETRETKSYELRNVAVTQVQNPHLFSLPLLHNKCLSYGELMLILGGVTSVRAYTFYSTAFKRWGEDGKMPGAYGGRFSLLQIRRILNRIERDERTRRAVVAIYNNEMDISPTGGMIDVACNVALHFVPNHGALDLNVFARSTDFRKGFVYDMGMWSILLHLVSGAAFMKPGELMFFTSSLHVYEEDRDYLNVHNGGMSHVHQPTVGSWSCSADDIAWLTRLENNVRQDGALGAMPALTSSDSDALHLYSLLPMIQLARNRKHVQLIRPFFEHPLWRINSKYYEFAAGSLLEGQR